MDQIVQQDSSHTRLRDKARQLLQEIEVARLPTLPNILLSLLKTSYDATDNRDQLASHLDKDPTLRLRLLSICQQHACTHQPGATTADMLQQLDAHTLKNLALTSTVQHYFSHDPERQHASKEHTRFLKQHWQHALLCASIAKAVAGHCHYPYPEDAYTAGLLHDIGQLLLHCAYPDIYTTLNSQHEDSTALLNLEQHEFACNHLYLGAELLASYNASSFLCDAILYHHEPLERIIDAHPLVKIVHFANQLANTDFNQGKDRKNSAIFDHAHQLFALPRADVIEILSAANSQLDACVVDFEIDLDDDSGDRENARLIQSRAEYVQSQLAEQIKYLGLLDGLHQQLSRTNEQRELFEAIAHYTHLIFGSEQNLVFLYEPEHDQLRATAPENIPHFAALTLPLKAQCSIVADCLLEQKALHSFLHQYSKLNIVDQQLLSACGTQGIICLPLVCQQEHIGALILAVDRPQQATLWKQLALLEHFSREIAHTLAARYTHNNKVGSGQIDYPTHIREVIHEVRNPLSIINNYLEILSLKLDSNNQAQTDIHTIRSEIHRVNDILQRLKNPTVNAGHISSVDINALLTELTDIFKTSMLANRSIQLKLELDASLRPITGNADALKQIYTNLIKNAAEALPDNGKIMVYTQGLVNVDGNTYIEIAVSDNGPGIRTEVMNQLFKPVRSDKGNGHAGIGLSIVKKLIAELNGSISCRSNDRGTSFQILLPDK